MDRTSKILLVLVFLALTANFLKPVFYPKQAFAEGPYQVAVLKSEFVYKLNKLSNRVEELEKKLLKKIEDVDNKFATHTHNIETCVCEAGTAKTTVETSKP